MGPIGWPELLIILVVVLLLFGTTRLAGLGKASGKAIREFKEETKSLKDEKTDAHQADGQNGPQQLAAGQQGYAQQPAAPQQQPYAQQPMQTAQPYVPQQLPNGQQPYEGTNEVYDAEVVDPNNPQH